MDVLIERCAGLDLHRDTVVATVRRPGPGGARRSETRTFTTMTGQLEVGRNIGVVAAARRLLTLVFYGLRDGHIRALAAGAA
jgi:hypothetical protein